MLESRVSIAAALLLLAGCTKATVDATGESVGLARGAAVAVSASEALESNSTVRCVANALGEGDAALRTVSARKFREAVFSDEALTSTGETLAARLLRLKDQGDYQDRIAGLGLRYMVLVDRPETDQSFGNFACEGAYAGFVCAANWERDSTVRARMIDLSEGREVGSVAAKVEGNRVLLLPLPLYIPAATEGEACREVGAALRRQLTGEVTSE